MKMESVNRKARAFRSGCHRKFSGILPHSARHRGDTYISQLHITTKAVDAILATRVRRTKKDDAKAITIGVQVTEASSHSDSGGAFMKSWAGETEFWFLWIVENMEGGPRENHQPSLENDSRPSGISEEVYVGYEPR